MTCSSLGVPSCCSPPTTVSYASTGLPSATQTTLRGALAASVFFEPWAWADFTAFASAVAALIFAVVPATLSWERDGLGDALERPGLALVHHEVTAEDGQPVVGALVAGVRGAVDVLGDVLDDQFLLRAEVELAGGLGGGGAGLPDQLRTLGGGQLGRHGAGVGRGVGGARPGCGGGAGAGLYADGEHRRGGDQCAGRYGASMGGASHTDSFCGGRRDGAAEGDRAAKRPSGQSEAEHVERVGGDVRVERGTRNGGTRNRGGERPAVGSGAVGPRAAVAGKSPTTDVRLSGSVQLIGRKPSVARNPCPEGGRIGR